MAQLRLLMELQPFLEFLQISTGNSIGKPVIRGLSGNRVFGVFGQGVHYGKSAIW